MEQILWNLFQKTGDIKYFLLAKKIERKIDGTKENRRNSSK